MSKIYRASIVGHMVDNLALIVGTLHYQTDLIGAADEPSPNDVASSIWSHIGTAYRAATSTKVRIDRVDLLEMVLPPDLPTGGTFVVDALGTLTTSSTSLSQATCMGINLHSDVRSRSSRGFHHLPPPISDASSLGQTFGGTYLSAANTLKDLLDDSLDIGVLGTDGSIHPVVYSRRRHVAGEDPFTFQVTSCSINPKMRYVRSRDTSP